MAASAAPVTALPFDVAERLEGVVQGIQLARSVGIPVRRVLDVGGAPGRMADGLLARLPELGLEIAVADLFECTRPGYVRASGMELPFRDRAFDLVYSCDTLEHIPAPLRETFLRECVRVAGGAMIVAAPFDSPASVLAETRLNDLHRRLFGQPHPWLREHRENGLPSLEATRRAVGSALGAPAEVIANAPLLRWFLLQAGDLLSQVIPGGREPWKALDPALGAAALRGTGAETGAPVAESELPYRRIVVGIRPGVSPASRDLIREDERRENISPVCYMDFRESESPTAALPVLREVPDLRPEGGENGGSERARVAVAPEPPGGEQAARTLATLGVLADFVDAMAASVLAAKAATESAGGSPASAEVVARLTRIVEQQERDLSGRGGVTGGSTGGGTGIGVALRRMLKGGG